MKSQHEWEVVNTTSRFDERSGKVILKKFMKCKLCGQTKTDVTELGGKK